MITLRFAGPRARLALLSTVLIVAVPVFAGPGGQDQPAAASGSPSPQRGGESLQAINDDYNRQLVQIERERLDRMARLAARQDAAEAASTYEQLFRLAIAANQFQDAEPAAETVMKNGSRSPTTAALAHLVNIISEADRGAYDESLTSLRQLVERVEKARKDGAPRADLQTSELIGICDAYYQRLVHADQIPTARQAYQLLLEHSSARPALKEFVAGRLKRLEMVGKPAPALRGTDLDGKPFDLVDLRGKVVLVEFWASWCLPSAAEIQWFQEVADRYHDRGLRIVGVNVDTVQEGGPKLETLLPSIRRFLLNYNVSWPTLVNGAGDSDYARAYGITEIPASVLIGKDGSIVQLDLVHKNLEPVVARAVGK
jgi:thiol-disulfide isomerase/thioredoxin